MITKNISYTQLHADYEKLFDAIGNYLRIRHEPPPNLIKKYKEALLDLQLYLDAHDIRMPKPIYPYHSDNRDTAKYIAIHYNNFNKKHEWEENPNCIYQEKESLVAVV